MDDARDEAENQAVPPDPSITKELFLEWRTPQRGASNPEILTNPVWTWLVKSRLSAYEANAYFEGPDAMDEGPGSCFRRFGQSSTTLADGHIVFIGGEHEDHYDADFFIYNDVVVKHPDGRIEILGYPAENFPPTDFHSATLVGNQILIVGNLGYREQRQPGRTQVLTLDLTTFVITPVQTSGASPGWLHGHTAEVSEDGNFLLIRQGKVDRGQDQPLVENIDDWRLDLANRHWERLTERPWLRWSLSRRDGRGNHLREIQQAMWSRSVGWEKDLEKQMERLEQTLGIRPNLDLAESLFRPPITHEVLPRGEEEYNIFRNKIHGVIVRYVLDMHAIQLTVEGELPPEVTEIVASDLVRKMAALENAGFVLDPLSSEYSS